MKQWEYRIIDSDDVPGGVIFGPGRKKIEQHLNRLGQAGWEIVTAFHETEDRHSFVAIAKREVEAPGP